MCTLLTCLYLTLNIGAMDGISEPAFREVPAYYQSGHYQYPLGQVVFDVNHPRDITNRSGGLGIAEFGTEVSVTRWLSLNILVRHQEFIDHKDHGENIVAGGFKIMPFRR